MIVNWGRVDQPARTDDESAGIDQKDVAADLALLEHVQRAVHPGELSAGHDVDQIVCGIGCVQVDALPTGDVEGLEAVEGILAVDRGGRDAGDIAADGQVGLGRTVDNDGHLGGRERTRQRRALWPRRDAEPGTDVPAVV